MSPNLKPIFYIVKRGRSKNFEKRRFRILHKADRIFGLFNNDVGKSFQVLKTLKRLGTASPIFTLSFPTLK